METCEGSCGYGTKGSRRVCINTETGEEMDEDLHAMCGTDTEKDILQPCDLGTPCGRQYYLLFLQTYSYIFLMNIF